MVTVTVKMLPMRMGPDMLERAVAAAIQRAHRAGRNPRYGITTDGVRFIAGPEPGREAELHAGDIEWLKGGGVDRCPLEEEAE